MCGRGGRLLLSGGGAALSVSQLGSQEGNIYHSHDSVQTGHWHLGCSADAVTVVKTYGFLSRTVGRKLPAGTSSDATSPTAGEPVGLVLAKERGFFGMTPPLGCREAGSQVSLRSFLKIAGEGRIIQEAQA